MTMDSSMQCFYVQQSISDLSFSSFISLLSLLNCLILFQKCPFTDGASCAEQQSPEYNSPEDSEREQASPKQVHVSVGEGQRPEQASEEEIQTLQQASGEQISLGRSQCLEQESQEQLPACETGYVEKVSEEQMIEAGTPTVLIRQSLYQVRIKKIYFDSSRHVFI